MQFIENKGIAKAEFYRKTEIADSNFKGRNLKSEIGGNHIVKILATYPEINSEWLLTGRGPMMKEIIEENSLLKEARPVYKVKPIPLVSVTAIGGFGNNSFSISERDVKDYYVIPKFRHKKVDFMLEVEGSSMYPKYSSGDVVACTVINENSFLQWNKTHVVATRGQGIIIKRIKKGSSDATLCMVSDNKDYDPFEVPKEEITGIALVVGVIRLE
ncbi:S24 family peptidase [Chryseobacterium sp.]|uniref:S24 family peptidase n=1 Tax=Chryseobacterium sp. TaxID=1871047 RepID=UPI002FCA51BA